MFYFVFRDAVIISAGDTLTSVFAGFVIFSYIGYMAHELQVPVADVATEGAGLAFIVYPQAVTLLPLSPIWAILFMLMLANVGLGTSVSAKAKQTTYRQLILSFTGFFREF